MNRLIASSAITLIVMCAILVSGVADAKDKETRYEVTITNITRGQIISPPIVISHNEDFQLFSLGHPAPTGLAELAEDGMTTDRCRTTLIRWILFTNIARRLVALCREPQ